MRFTKLLLVAFIIIGNTAHADIDFIGNTAIVNGFKLEIRFTGEYGRHVALHGEDGSGVGTVVYLIARNETPDENPIFGSSIELFEQLIQNANVGSNFNIQLACNTFPEFRPSGAPGTSQSLQFLLHDLNNLGCRLRWLREFPVNSVYFPNNRTSSTLQNYSPLKGK